MIFEESIPIAKQLAENQLRKGFDKDAFLILAEISRMQVVDDEVPDSNIDEQIKHLLDVFINYHNAPSHDNLDMLLKTIKQILSELQHVCCTGDKYLFEQFKTL